jgi:hypothetical protein
MFYLYREDGLRCAFFSFSETTGFDSDSAYLVQADFLADTRMGPRWQCMSFLVTVFRSLTINQRINAADHSAAYDSLSRFPMTEPLSLSHAAVGSLSSKLLQRLASRLLQGAGEYANVNKASTSPRSCSKQMPHHV